MKIRKKSILPKFEAVNESPSIFEGVFRHFVINLSEKIIITVKSKGTGGLIIVFKRIGDVKETF